MNSFEWIRDLDARKRHIFGQVFDRNLGFHVFTDSDPRLCMCNGEDALHFFRLLFETWINIYHASLIGDPNGFIVHDDDYATCREYLESEPESVKNDEIEEFVKRCIKRSVFVASAYGFKNMYPDVPSGYLDIGESNQFDAFGTKVASYLARTFTDNFNSGPYPPYFSEDPRFRHDLCPVIFGIDIGQELKSLSQNSSLICSGFSGRKYLDDSLKITKSVMRQHNSTHTLSGTYHANWFGKELRHRLYDNCISIILIFFFCLRIHNIEIVVS
jgi:hypothetical protein